MGEQSVQPYKKAIVWQLEMAVNSAQSSYRVSLTADADARPPGSAFISMSTSVPDQVSDYEKKEIEE